MKISNVVTTFCGAGGSSLGYKKAGLKILLAADWERKAVLTYRTNFPTTKLIQYDIRKLRGDQIFELTGLQKYELDLLDGSPPCTAFSLSGLREKGWNREYLHTGDSEKQQTKDLFFEFIRLIDEVRPKLFLAENVKGLISGAAKGYFNKILRAMRELDYNVKVLLVNAKDFEVPQSRERIFFIGIRNDIPFNSDIKLKTHPVITFRQAIRGIKQDLHDLNIAWIPKSSVKYGLLAIMKEGQHLSSLDPHQSKKGSGCGFNSIKLYYDKPAPTITANCHTLMHPLENRKLTVAELKRLSTFPDDFKFPNIREARYRMGNSVPPNLVYHIINYVQELVKD